MGQFQQLLREYDIDFSRPVRIRDGGSLVAAARVWWLFTLFGHPQVTLPGETGESSANSSASVSGIALRNRYLTGLGDLLDDLPTRRLKVVDARPALRFQGLAAEAADIPRVGHIPYSLNLPVSTLFDTHQRLLPPDRLQQQFVAAGLRPHDRIVTTCGSGLTASLLAYALATAGYKNWSVYDGSWQEWSRSPLTPVAQQQPDGRSLSPPAKQAHGPE